MTDDREKRENVERILRSPSYRVAYKDIEFLSDPRLRPMRMELELLKPELALREAKVRSTIVVFGSTRIVEPAEAERNLHRAKATLADTPDDPRRQRAVARAKRIAAKSEYYDHAREFARLVSAECQQNEHCDYVVVTGGGPGIMEAANRGAYDAEAKSIGLNVQLPHEQEPNPYISPELCFQFHYFAMRKFHFILRAKGLVVFPGGFGTLDELFDALTLRQTGRMQNIPIIMFGRKHWEKVVNFQFLADEGTIDDDDLDLFRYAETAQEAWDMIQKFHQRHGD
ncbi:MAG: TIGR00730 family Rossman fold protein [Planctomycetes bacterium]|nr:TIGR00730 family Rossman fold protein [Planctomycetota bacterium]